MSVATGVCRVCGADGAIEVGHVEYLEGFDWAVWDCHECGCRFTRHDRAVHSRFHHAPAISYYRDYLDMAEHCAKLFRQQDIVSLKRYLRQWPKYRFVIDDVQTQPRSSRLLEVGCSRGYLTSCLILEGRSVLGIDVSSEAIASARDAFGDHFAVAGTGALEAGSPYDVIYHVGLIGCVADPTALTRELLSLLKPGGRLLFNAPNRAALHLREQLWLDSAPPPDLVTLFPQGFWTQRFASQAEVTETIEWHGADDAFSRWLDRLLCRRWQAPAALPTSGMASAWGQSAPGPLARAARRVAKLTGFSELVPRHPSDFGLFVRMTAK